ncbi:MAG TPA: WbqC family protein [Acidobacteriota bacterium]
MRILAAHQPQYLPWLGFFDKLDAADVFVLLDDVQFKKNEWQNRNRIKTATGWQWITVPVRHRFPQSIAEVEIRNDEPWSRKHQRALESNYGKAPCFGTFMPLLAEVLERRWERLAPLNSELISRLAERLGIGTEIRLGSSLDGRPDPTLRLVDLCRQLDADTYLSGAGGDYLDESAFADAGLALRFQRFEHPVYPQQFGTFEPCMSVVDLLMNCGSDSLSRIRSGRRAPRSPSAAC